MALLHDPATRFTGRAAIYQAHRPGYPEEILPFLVQHAYLSARSRILDLGCGTGIFSALLLQLNVDVMGIEPNADMRNQAMKTLAAEPRFHAMATKAESTMLPGASCNLATAAQAYHWFDEVEVAKEIRRVVRPPHLFFAVWNERDASDPFGAKFSAICKEFRKDAVSQTLRQTQSYPSILNPETIVEFNGVYEQALDLKGLIGRAESNSGFEVGSPDAHSALKDLFDTHEQGGEVVMRYVTKGWLGEVAAP